MSNYVLIEMYVDKYTSKNLNEQLLRVGVPLLPQSSNPITPKFFQINPKAPVEVGQSFVYIIILLMGVDCSLNLMFEEKGKKKKCCCVRTEEGRKQGVMV